MSFKDKKSVITTTIDIFSIYLSLAVSEKNVYGVMANEGSNTAKVFVYFLDKLLKYRDKIIGEIESEA